MKSILNEIRLTQEELLENFDEHLDWVETTGGAIVIVDNDGNDRVVIVPYEWYAGHSQQEEPNE